MCVVIDVVPLYYDVLVGADIICPWFCCNNKMGRHSGLPLRCFIYDVIKRSRYVKLQILKRKHVEVGGFAFALDYD